jgi:pilus assembly protein Flp/PilA
VRDNIDTSLKFIRHPSADIFVTERVAFVTIPVGPQTRRGVGKYLVAIFLRRAFFQEISMLSIFRRLVKSERGATAIEYTLIASLIAVAAIAAMGVVGNKVNAVLNNVANAMN